jgi:phenylacetic acid degradation operon negative regulatory protein
MNWKPFHHPDWSLPVIRRRATEEWLDLFSGVGEILLSRGRSVNWNKTYPTEKAYQSAMLRLQKSGLIIRTNPKETLPHLTLTQKAETLRPAYQRPDKFWNTKWNEIWYTLVFDVPENSRHYRDSLRRLLKQMRMGCLQRSVWITPRDIRPEYADLEKSAAVGTVSYLLESRTVLHLDQQEMVLNAWDFDWLHKLHARYLNVFEENLAQLERPTHTQEDLMELLRQESEAYIHAMRPDPLLPNELLPKNYLGKKIWKLRTRLRAKIAQAL